MTGDAIRVVQGKTGASLLIPMHRELKQAIADTPNGNLPFLTTAFGKAFTAAGFGNWFREACDAAGLKERSAHVQRQGCALPA